MSMSSGGKGEYVCVEWNGQSRTFQRNRSHEVRCVLGIGFTFHLHLHATPLLRCHLVDQVIVVTSGFLQSQIVSNP